MSHTAEQRIARLPCWQGEIDMETLSGGMTNLNFKDTYPKDASEIRNTHINLGTGVDISIRELAEKIKNIVGFQGAFVYDRDKPDGTMQKLTDVTRLNNLGWRHKISLDEGLKLMYTSYLERQQLVTHES